MAGGTGSIEANTTAVSGWSAASLDPWIVLTGGDGFGAGPRTIQYSVSSNDAGIVRDGRIRVGSTIVAIHQDGDGDVTPPVITPIVTGTLGGDGWYIGTVTVQWTVTDPESQIVESGLQLRRRHHDCDRRDLRARDLRGHEPWRRQHADGRHSPRHDGALHQHHDAGADALCRRCERERVVLLQRPEWLLRRGELRDLGRRRRRSTRRPGGTGSP